MTERGRRPKLNFEQSQDLGKKYAAGVNTATLAKEYQLSLSTVLRTLDQLGIERKKRISENIFISEQEVEEARRMGIDNPEAGIPDKDTLFELFGLTTHISSDDERIRHYNGVPVAHRKHASLDSDIDRFGEHDLWADE